MQDWKFVGSLKKRRRKGHAPWKVTIKSASKHIL